MPDNIFGIFEANGTYVQSDMDLFFQQITPNIPVGTTPKNVLINGVQFDEKVSDNPSTTVEGNTDFQLAWPLIYPHNITMFAAIPTKAEMASILQSNATDLQQLMLELDFALEDLFSTFDVVSL